MKSIISKLLANSGYACQGKANLASIMGLKGALVTHYKSVTTFKLWYMHATYGYLAHLAKGDMAAFQREVDDGVGHDTENEGDENQSQEGGCIVCHHEAVEAINKRLQEGTPLRELESEYGISRSTLSRHRNRCLNLGAIRVQG
ncbi:hypothetical protein ACFLX5_04290 [Chloroflexota bacterium]